MIDPCADQRRAAVNPRTAPAKIKNQLVPLTWKLWDPGERVHMEDTSGDGYAPPERTQIEGVADSTEEERVLGSKHWQRGQLGEYDGLTEDLQLLIPPLMRPVRANMPYRTPLDVSESDTSWVPPAPKLETAWNMPTVAKLAANDEHAIAGCGGCGVLTR